MAFCSFSTEAVINDKIEIDNIFINEFLPYAPESAVKVYLYGRYMCTHSTAYDNTLDKFSEILKLTEQDIIDCFLYWQECGLVQVLSTYPIEIRYMPIKNFINNTKKFNKNKYSLFNQQAQEIIKGRMITPNEYVEYYTLIESFHLEPEALLMIMAYCVSIKGETINYPYITTIAKNWASENILTSQHVEDRLKEYENKTSDIKELFKLLSLTRKPSHQDHELFLKWTEKLGFENGVIFYVAKHHKKKNHKFNIENLDIILGRYYELKISSIKEIEEFENIKDNLKNTAKNTVKSLGLYYENLDVVIDNYINPWTQLGYNDETIILIANYCFKKSIRTLEGMNGVILKLYKLGLISLEAIMGYINQLSVIDGEIKQVLEKIHIDRTVNSFDREFYKTWKTVWKINDKLFEYGLSLAKEKVQPMQYLNRIFAKWFENKIESIEDAKKLTTELFSVSEKSIKTNGHSYSKDQLDALFDSLEEVEI